MATFSSTSQLSRTRSGRLPATSRPIAGSASGLDRNARPPAGSSSVGASVSAPSPIPMPTSNVSIFLTNLRLLDLDLLPGWPDITTHTFSGKDAKQGQKKRIQSVEWSLYHLFCLWDPEEARSKMLPFFPPADQVQSVNLRAALLRGLEKAKKDGALGRDAILRKTMLDECRGDRLEEILAVFSSAVLKAVAAAEDSRGPHPPSVRSIALESRGYSTDRKELHALILSHKASLHTLLRQKNVARERYQDFSELLGLKERSLARRREADNAEAAAGDPGSNGGSASDPVLSHDAKLDLWRLVRNNWSGPEPWMDALLYDGDDRLRRDALLATNPDRVWRRVQAGRLGELESSGADGGLLEQLERRVQGQQERVQQWEEYRQRVFGKGATLEIAFEADGGVAAAAKRSPPAKAGINLGFDAHESLRPSPTSAWKPASSSPPVGAPAELDSTEYAELLQGLQAELDGLGKTRQKGQDLLDSLFPMRSRTAIPTRILSASAQDGGGNSSREEDGEDDQKLSDISDMDDHPIVVQLLPPAVSSAPGSPLLATAESPGPSPTRPRVLLTKRSLTFNVKTHRHESDEEPDPMPAPRKTTQNAATAFMQVNNKEKEEEGEPLQRLRTGVRRRPQRPRSPPIRLPTTPDAPASPHSPPPRTPSPPPDNSEESVAAFDHYGPLHTPMTTTTVPTKNNDSPLSPSGALADQILTSMQNASPSPVKQQQQRRPRHTLSLAERTRLTMAHASRGGSSGGVLSSRNSYGTRDSQYEDEDEDEDEGDMPERYRLPIRRNTANAAALSYRSLSTAMDSGGGGGGGSAAEDGAASHREADDLVARTRKSMMAFDFEAAQKKAQLERRRSQRQSQRQSSIGGGGSRTAYSHRRETSGGGSGSYCPVVIEAADDGDTTVVLAEELMSGQQDDAEAIFRSRPRIKLSPIPSPMASPTRDMDE